MLRKVFVPAIFSTTLFAHGAYASPCNALADFFAHVVEVSGAEYDKKQLKAHVTDIRAAKSACQSVTDRMADARVYTHSIGGKLVPLQDYLVKDARFAVRVIGSGDKVDSIEFDIDAVGVLRRRPTR